MQKRKQGGVPFAPLTASRSPGPSGALIFYSGADFGPLGFRTLEEELCIVSSRQLHSDFVTTEANACLVATRPSFYPNFPGSCLFSDPVLRFLISGLCFFPSTLCTHLPVSSSIHCIHFSVTPFSFLSGTFPGHPDNSDFPSWEVLRQLGTVLQV